MSVVTKKNKNLLVQQLFDVVALYGSLLLFIVTTNS